MNRFDVLKDSLAASIMERVKSIEHWKLVSITGQEDVLEAAEMLVECQLARAMGEDVSAAEMALKITIENWGMAGRIKVEGMGDEFIDLLKEALIEGGQIVLSMLGAGLRTLIIG